MKTKIYNRKFNIIDNNKVIIVVKCVNCGIKKDLICSQKQINDLLNGELIHKVFPLVPIDIREMFLSGLCGKCFDNLMSDYDI